MSRLGRLLGIGVPLVQAPTASIAGPELAAAVSAAGALGAMGLTWTEPGDAREAVRQVRRRTPKPFGVNFALAFPPRSLEAALEAGAPVVLFSWGDPGRLIERARERGALVGVQVGAGEGAAHAVDSGAHFVICQGVEAGGHVQSTTPLWELLEEVLERVGARVPVVAAGGLADADQAAEAVRRGADGVMLGTRFVASLESRAHALYKEALARARAGDARLTVCFDGGWPLAPHRVLRNATLAGWEAAGCPPPGARPGEGEVVGLSAAGEPILRYEDTAPREGMTGRVEEMALYAGTGVGRIQGVRPAAEIVLEIGTVLGHALAQRREQA